MANFRFVALASNQALAYQSGAVDANGQMPERQLSDEGGVPCRYCLAEVDAGAPFLVLAHRPFPGPQPYAEIGPIFLHANSCARYSKEGEPPAMFSKWDNLLLRGYGRDDRIVYGTGKVVATSQLAEAIGETFTNEKVAYIHLRSAKNNCFMCRVERA